MQNLFFRIIQKVSSLTRTFYMISALNMLKLFTAIVFLTFILRIKLFTFIRHLYLSECYCFEFSTTINFHYVSLNQTIQSS